MELSELVEDLTEVSSVHEDLTSRTATAAKIQELQNYVATLEPEMVEGLVIVAVVRQNADPEVKDETGGIPTDIVTHCLGPINVLSDIARLLLVRVMQAQLEGPHNRRNNMGALN